jgi:hypothetical protein
LYRLYRTIFLSWKHYQFGFRLKRLPQDASLVFEQRVMKAMHDCDGKTAAIGAFFDADKAYDQCPHEGDH